MNDFPRFSNTKNLLYFLHSLPEKIMRFLILLSLVLLSAPAFAQNNDMRALMSRMDQIQRQMDTVSRQVYNGAPPSDAVSTPAATSGGGNNAGLAAAMDERMSSIEGSLRQLNNRLDEQDYATSQLKQQFELYKSDMEVRLKELSTKTTASAAPVAEDTAITASQTPNTSPAAAAVPVDAAGDAMALPTDNAATLYDASFQALREQKYERAETGFKEFLKRFSSDTLAGNAQYWLGETYYVRANYPEAAKSFAIGYQKYPKSSKAPDNLLKLGLSLAQNNKPKEACVTLQQLGIQYKNAAAVIKQRAQDELTKLNCGGATVQ